MTVTSTSASAAFACRACGCTDHSPVIDLGAMPPSNALVRLTEVDTPQAAYPLRAVFCQSCGLVQIDHSVPPQELFGDYVYFSSYSTSWLEHARNYRDEVVACLALGTDAFIAEVASNDGYLLRQFVERGNPVLGIEPSDTVAAAARAAGVPTEERFFGSQTARLLSSRGIAADLMAANNVLAHVPDLNDFVAGFPILLKPEGVLTIEFPHLLHLINQIQYDTIYHEHFSYFSFTVVERLLSRHGLVVFNVQQLPTHGGSLRVWAKHTNSNRPVQSSVAAMRALEEQARLLDPVTYTSFASRCAANRDSFRAFLERAKAEGKMVVGYGAAAKAAVRLHYCGVGPGDMLYVVDRNPHKQHRLLPGSRIPVKAPDCIMTDRPDYLVVLPWNLKDEIMTQMNGIRAWGGQFVIPSPTIEII